MSKTLRIIFILVVVVISTAIGAHKTIARQDARHVIRECMAATEAMEKSPPGFARADEFVRRIRAIDTKGAPKDLVDALHEHIDLLERSLIAARAGNDTKVLDAQVAAAKERFATAVRKYW